MTSLDFNEKAPGAFSLPNQAGVRCRKFGSSAKCPVQCGDTADTRQTGQLIADVLPVTNV